jgi:hypothetical protein
LFECFGERRAQLARLTGIAWDCERADTARTDALRRCVEFLRIASA